VPEKSSGDNGAGNEMHGRWYGRTESKNKDCNSSTYCIAIRDEGKRREHKVSGLSPETPIQLMVENILCINVICLGGELRSTEIKN